MDKTAKEWKLTPTAFRRKVSWAILSPNVFGMPFLPVLIIEVLNVPLTQLRGALTGSPVFFVYGFGLLGFIAIMLVGVHYLMVSRYMRPIFRFVRSSDPAIINSRKEAYKVSNTSQKVPYYAMYLSDVYYVIGILVIDFSIFPFFRFTWGQVLALFLVSMSVGALISFFQYFNLRRVLNRFVETTLTRFPDLVQDKTLNTPKHKVRNRMMMPLMTLCVALVILTGTIAYSNAVQSFQLHNGQLYVDRLGQDFGEVKIDSFQTYAEELRIDYEDYIILTDDQGQLLSGDAPEEIDGLWKRILNAVPQKLALNQPILFKLSDDEIYAGQISSSRYTLVHRPVGDLYHLFVVIPERTHELSLRLVWGFILAAAFIALILTFIYTRFAVVDIDQPLSSLTNSIQEVAQGNLNETVTVLSQDEIGTLSLNLSNMITSLRNMLGKIDSASHSVSDTNNKLAVSSDLIEQGATLQASSVEQTSASMEEMNISSRQIAESVETLARSAEESSASILEMGATIDEVAKNVETLSEAVEETTSSLQEMNASLQEVASNVQQLSSRSNQAVKNMQDMESAIRGVGESSKQTAGLSELVSEDADQGAKAVELTIKGIERIRKSSEEAASVIDSLSGRAQEIGNILNVIDDITEETNLLALNAAIIAAQAGEHGKGFAVVADEIRDLAERTSASTKEIADLIKAVQEGAQNAVATVFKSSRDVEEGVRLSQEAGAALAQILKRAHTSMERTREIASSVERQREQIKSVMAFFENINTMISQVANAIQEQSRGSDLIFKASQRMEQVAQQVKRAIREQTLGSKQITQAIENISQIVNYINTAQSEQLKNSQGVLEAVKHIRKVAEENTERVKEVKRVVESLTFLSKDLNELVEQFKLSEGKTQEGGEVFKL